MIALRRLFNRQPIQIYRNYATNTNFVEVAQDDTTGVTILSMARAPVNGLNLELLDAIRTSLIEAQKNRSKGVILTSSLPTIFSAGLDIMEMYKPDIKRATEFWKMFQDTWMTLYNLQLPVAAAINGSSPAGGCMLAMSCEYRVCVDGKYGIGMNESRLGIIAPTWMRNTYISTIGYRKAELELIRGTLFLPQEALKIGLVDELVPNKAEAIKKCQDYISSFKKIPSQARNMTKLELRKEATTWLKENRDADLNIFLTTIQLPIVQSALKLYIESLKQK
ncbi:hypothetical protein KM043_018742 [Ampulex compressa]|nr:hypothetical protein KM043_018742 [Ampulex compressa]